VRVELRQEMDTRSRWTGIVPVLVYAIFIAYQTLADGGTWGCGGAVLEWPSHHVSRVDVLANIVAYVPLGWLCAYTATAGGRRGGRRIPLVLASVGAVALFSLVLEAAQSCQAARVSSAIDWATNTAGAAIGAVFALLLPTLARVIETRAARTRATGADARLRVGAMAVVVLWLVAQTLPWSFTADVGVFRQNLAFLQHWPDGMALDRWTTLRHAGAWLALAAACRLSASSRLLATAALLTVAAAGIGLQVMLVVPSPLSAEELLGIAVAVALGVPSLMLLPDALGDAWWARVLLAGVVVVVAAYELRPSPGAIQAFSWLPLVGFGQRLGALDFAALFAWAGCGAVVAAHAAQRQRDRAQARRWPLAMLVLLFALELAQTRIPGRGPDTSAMLFMILAMLGTGAWLRGGR
jgi:VanZ family protein